MIPAPRSLESKLKSTQGLAEGTTEKFIAVAVLIFTIQSHWPTCLGLPS